MLHFSEIMVGFRILLNLSHYFSDYRQKSWVYVDPIRLKTLSDLKKHICEVFAIDDDFEVFVSDSYIPSKEDVGIINEKDVLELRRIIADAGATVTLRDEFSAPTLVEEDVGWRKIKKRKKNSEKKLETDNSIDYIDPLPENFNPEYDSTMTARKKRKKHQHSSPGKEFLESSLIDSSKKIGIKSNQTKEQCLNADEVISSYSAQMPNDEIENFGPVGMDIKEKKSAITSTASKINSLERSVNDVKSWNTSEVDRVAGDKTSTELNSTRSTFENSILEHSKCERAGDIAERENEISETIVLKKKRSRRGKRKHRRTSVKNNINALGYTKNVTNTLVFPCKPSPIKTISNSRKHRRFSDSEDDEKVSFPAGEEYKSFDANELKEFGTCEANCDADVDVRIEESLKPSSNLSVVSIADVGSVGDEKSKEVNGNPHVIGKILKYESTDEVVNDNNSGPQNNSLPVRKWRRKSVLNTGLGATLAHLMKNVKTSEACVSKDKLRDLTTAVKSQPPPTIPDNPSSSNKNYSDSPVIKNFPRKGDILAFKILKMNDHYEPCISNFIECVITSCDQEESMITIRILEGAKEFERVNGKFEIQLEGEEEKIESKDVVLTMEWKDIIEPRLIFP